MFSVSFKNESCIGYGIIPVKRPNIPAPEERVEEVEIPGRNGILVMPSGLYDYITISVQFNFMSDPDECGQVFRKAKRWITGSGDLWFSDDPSVFYKVLKCKITDVERASKKIENFTVEFTCDPFTYYKSGKEEIPLEADIFNPGYVCEPKYKISGEGLCALNVNGNTFTANVGQEIIIDSSRQIAYKTDGQMLNTDATGDYSWLWLNPGENTLSVSDGFTVTITPEWRDI